MERRARVLAGQLGGTAGTGAPTLERRDCQAAYGKRLPRFDVTLMETHLDDLRSFKAEVYELFRQHPELLVAEEEGMTKGEGAAAFTLGRHSRPPFQPAATRGCLGPPFLPPDLTSPLPRPCFPAPCPCFPA